MDPGAKDVFSKAHHEGKRLGPIQAILSIMREKLESFLRRVFVRMPGITFAELRSAAPGNRGKLIDSFPVVAVSDEDLREISIGVEESAQNNADAVGGVVRYELHLIKEGGTTAAQYAFRMRGEDESSDGGEERADASGVLAQTMRHHEAMARLYTQTMHSAIGTLAARIDDDAKTIASLRREQSEQYALLESARSEEAQREVMMLEHVEKQRLAQWGVGKLDALLPLIIARLSGKPLSSTQESSVLQSFLQGLSSEQLAGMARTLSSEQQVVFWTMLKQLTSGSGSDTNHS